MTIHLLAPQDKSKWPELWHKCYNTISPLPYNIKIWSDEEIDKELFNDNKDFYNNFLNHLHPIYKWDYIRYLIFEKYGGAYLDMDVEIISNFFELLDLNKIYISEGHWNCSVSNHIIVSPINYIVWNSIKEKSKLNIMENFTKCKEDPNNVLNTVGPIFLSNFTHIWDFSYQKLSFHHFSNVNSTLSFSKHHCTGIWSASTT